MFHAVVTAAALAVTTAHHSHSAASRCRHPLQRDRRPCRGSSGRTCRSSCTLSNVTWLDVGEDAATFRGTNATVLIDGGSAAHAADKVFQDNRLAGGALTIRDFTVSDFGKLYRSCGDCSRQAARTATITHLTATAPGDVLAGVNANLGDRVTISGARIAGGVDACNLFNDNEPARIGSKPDGVHCIATGITTT